MGKTLILSVGGSLSPIIFSIKHHQPDKIIFFTSKETEKQISEILQQIDLNQTHYFDKIITYSAENINDCLKAILSRLPEILARWQTTPDDIIVDYTGGTKSMSSALVIGTVEYTKCFSYIGGKDEQSRNKDGIGVVIDGKEKILIIKNPWDELALEAKKKLCFLFNLGRYGAAKEVAEQAEAKVSGREKSLFTVIKSFCDIYYHWDAFRYKTASHNLKKAIRELEDICCQLPNHHSLVRFLDKTKENEEFLNILIYDTKERQLTKARNDIDDEIKMAPEKRDMHFLLDLLANAKRRARLEQRYDDALVRLYRAIEKRAQMELTKYNLKADDIKLNLIPEKIKKEIHRKYYN